ncbi:hypothetical protein [Nonomuraea sp. NPDC001831]|uniref:hypothetical protein n=1 Tax=Nonomuraea sp. NPDC001831 TaxID=3364340 RepID=UPI0036A13869
MNNFASERELVDRVLERMQPWFHVQREVVGTSCSGRRLRVDAMLRPRDVAQWRNRDVAFGVEFKLPDRYAGLNVYTRWLAQAVDYTHVHWDGYGRRIVLTCPGVTSYLKDYLPARDGRASEVLVVKRVAGQLGVGELVLQWGYGLTILVNGERIWSERAGVHNGRYWDLTPREGSR